MKKNWLKLYRGKRKSGGKSQLPYLRALQAERVVFELKQMIPDENELKEAVENSFGKWWIRHCRLHSQAENIMKKRDMEIAKKMAYIYKTLNSDYKMPPEEETSITSPIFMQGALNQAVITYLGLKSEQPLDHVLELTARALNKPIFGLESYSDQYNVLFGTSLNFPQQLKFVMSGLEGTAEQYINAVKEKLETLQTSYLKDDLETIVDITSPIFSTPELEAINKKLDYQRTVQRDAIMFENMQEHLSHGNVFIAFGCKHLPGILMKLEKAEYTVEAIPILSTSKEKKISIPLPSQRQRLFGTPSNDAIQPQGYIEDKTTKCTYYTWW